MKKSCIAVALVFALSLSRDASARDIAAFAPDAPPLHLVGKMWPHQVLGKPAVLQLSVSASKFLTHLVLRFRGRDNWAIHYNNPVGSCAGADQLRPQLLRATKRALILDFGSLGKPAAKKCVSYLQIVPLRLGHHKLVIEGYLDPVVGKANVARARRLPSPALSLSATVTSNPWGTDMQPAAPATFRVKLGAAIPPTSQWKKYIPLRIHLTYQKGWVRHLILQMTGGLRVYGGGFGGVLCGTTGLPIQTTGTYYAWDYGPGPERAGCDAVVPLTAPAKGHYDITLRVYASNAAGATRRSSAGRIDSPVLGLFSALPVKGVIVHLPLNVPVLPSLA